METVWMSAVAESLRERIRRLPGMDALLPALAGLPPAYLVGGAVRDLLRGAPAVDLDVAIEGDALGATRALGDRLSGAVVEYARFGTATVRAETLAFDVAATRRERYERPGALPRVEPAPLTDDLRRRDFTINSMAIGLTGDDLGHLYDPTSGRGDLDAGIVRVQHDRSFVDDPTRLLRAVRYESRLGFVMDPGSERLARAAAEEDGFATVSGPRVRDELLDLAAELHAPGAIERLHELGLDSALHPALDADAELAASAALGALETGADRALAVLAALVSGAPVELSGWVEELGLGRADRDAVLAAARDAAGLAAGLRARELRPSEIHALLRGEPPEALALALALRAPPEPVLRFVRELRGVQLEVTGDDLRAAGIPESPAIGAALGETLERKLDGGVDGRDAELRFALEAARRQVG
jgi:tRNA nucleotidyltransferase (CCA-adding enzyme)